MDIIILMKAGIFNFNVLNCYLVKWNLSMYIVHHRCSFLENQFSKNLVWNKFWKKTRRQLVILLSTYPILTQIPKFMTSSNDVIQLRNLFREMKKSHRIYKNSKIFQIVFHLVNLTNISFSFYTFFTRKLFHSAS